jgi:hypothetical protein
MPAAASAAIASRRRSGVAARGSMRRASPRSSVVTDTATMASRSRAISARMSISRVTRADLVTIVTGWRNSRRTSRIDRVMPSRRSAGW